MAARHIFVTGGTGYMGRRLVASLLERGHVVRALVRPGSEAKLAPGAIAVLGDALQPGSYRGQVRPADTLVHLIGVSHPNPWAGDQFGAVDLASIKAVVPAAVEAGIAHFIYVSVAHPAPVMRAYIEVRTECEAVIRARGLNATILRPWYVLTPLSRHG